MNATIARALRRILDLGNCAAARPDEATYPRLIALAWRDFDRRREMLLSVRAAVRHLNTAALRYVMDHGLEDRR